MVARQHHLIAPLMEQPQYNMFHRNKVEVEFAQLYKGVGLGTTIWSPLASGLLSGKHTQDLAEGSRFRMQGLEWLRDRELDQERLNKVKELSGIASEIGLSMPVLALAWCLKDPNVSTVILGASKVEQLQQNLEAVEAQDQLTPDIMARINVVLNNEPERPQW